MREIKFRLIKDNKIVGYEEHRRLNDGMGKYSVHVYHSRTGHPMSWKEIIRIYPEEYLQHDTKNQFTGLKDENWKEIYENDILENIDTRKYTRFNGERAIVEYHGFGFELERQRRIKNKHVHVGFVESWWSWLGGDFKTRADRCKIIGNIYENPELLEKE